MSHGRLAGKALGGVCDGHGTRARRGRPLVRTAGPNAEPGYDEDHKYGHERDIDVMRRALTRARVHKCPSARPHSRLTSAPDPGVCAALRASGEAVWIWENREPGRRAMPTWIGEGAMGSVRRVVASGFVVALAMVFSGWGGASAMTGQRVTKAALKPYVVRAGDEPGYRSNGASFFGSTDFGSAPAAVVKRLRAEGYRGLMFEGVSGPNGASGTAQVIVLGSATGAKSELKADVSPSLAVQPHFTIKQIPTSVGFTGKSKSQHGAVVFFVEGSCELALSNTASGAPRPVVIAGALAIYDRTAHSGGVCG